MTSAPEATIDRPGSPESATPGALAPGSVVLAGISKNYGEQRAVDDLSLTIQPGEFLSLLGPSGCGKTTTLRMVAGFIKPPAGEILLRGRDVTGLPPHKRDTGLVFQNYALFPHMTVAENIAFGLVRRGVPRDEQKVRIAAMIDKLKLTGLEGRYPKQLSGGQQQRVAVARALVINPAILLLDEPRTSTRSCARAPASSCAASSASSGSPRSS